MTSPRPSREHTAWLAPERDEQRQWTKHAPPFAPSADGPAASPWIRALRIDLATRLEDLVAALGAPAPRCAAISTPVWPGTRCRCGAPRPWVAGCFIWTEGLRCARRSLRCCATGISCALLDRDRLALGIRHGHGRCSLCSFFATMDDPVPAMHKFITALLWSLPVSGFLCPGVMPLAHDFGMLVLCIAPVFLVVGCYMARPTSSLAALGMFFGVAGTLALQDTATADLVSFISSNLALFVGAVIAARVTALMRSVGRDWTAKRIRRATWHDLADLAAHPQDASARDAFWLTHARQDRAVGAARRS